MQLKDILCYAQCTWCSLCWWSLAGWVARMRQPSSCSGGAGAPSAAASGGPGQAMTGCSRCAANLAIPRMSIAQDLVMFHAMHTLCAGSSTAAIACVATNTESTMSIGGALPDWSTCVLAAMRSFRKWCDCCTRKGRRFWRTVCWAGMTRMQMRMRMSGQSELPCKQVRTAPKDSSQIISLEQVA